MKVRRSGSALMRHMPWISGLPDCRIGDYQEATKEVFVNLILSTSPLWLGSLITFGVDPHHKKTWARYWEVLLQTLRGGELLIYATAAIAPIFYFALVRGRQSRDYPSRISHIVSALLIFMVGTTLFGVQRSGVAVDPDFILPSSALLYGFSLVIIFLATLYRNWRDVSPNTIDTAEKQAVNEEDAFVQAAMEHRDG